LCLHKKAPVLFDKLKAMMEAHISDSLMQLSYRTADHTHFLNLMLHCWTSHCNQMKIIRSIFLHLDRTFVFQNREIRSLWNLGLDIFAKCFLETPTVQQSTIKGLLSVIENERKEESVDRSMLKSLIRMFSALKIPEMFEAPLLETSRRFYEAEGFTLLVNILTVPEYLQHVAKRLAQEEDRVKSYMNENSLSPLILVVETELVKIHSTKIIEKGFDDMLSANKIDDLSRMYSLLSRVRCLAEVKKAFAVYIKKTGSAIVMDKEKDSTMIKSLIEFKARLDQVLRIAFQQNVEFMSTMRDMFEAFINERANKPAELMAKYVDELLRVGHRSLSEDELDATLNQVMVLFKFINGKDVFEAFYKKDLAKVIFI
jgi:cullin-4